MHRAHTHHHTLLHRRTCSSTPELVSTSKSLTQVSATARVMATATWSCCRGAATTATDAATLLRPSHEAGNAAAGLQLLLDCCMR